MENEAQKVDLEVLLDFARANGWSAAVRGVVSLGVVIALLALYNAFAPRKESYRAEVQITLESREGVPVYPNGDSFSMCDLTSAPVLNRVWKKHGFDAKGVSFAEFRSWFSVFAYDAERAKIDAEFHAKMARRNISVTELTEVQKEYEAKLASLSADRFAVTVRPEALLSCETAAEVLADVPETWFREYAAIKAPTIPAVASADVISAYVERCRGAGGWELELVDVIRRYLSQLEATCEFVRSGIMRGRNAVVGDANLDAYEAQLVLLQAEALRLKNRLLANGGGEDAGAYVAARLDALACEQLELEDRVQAVRQTLDLLGEPKRTVTASAQKSAATAETTPVTVQVDTGFFSDFATMVRRDANQELVRKYAQELMALRQQQAELAARKLYYDQVERQVKGNAKSPAAGKTDEKASQAIVGFAEGLLAVGKRIVAFRDRCLEIYRTSDQFYVIAAPAAYAKSFAFSQRRLALGLFALWFLYNLAFLVRIWNKHAK